MNLNRQGTVVGLAGTNADGEALLEGYDGRGKDKVTVADELIDRAIEMASSPTAVGSPSRSTPRTRPCSRPMERSCAPR